MGILSSCNKINNLLNTFIIFFNKIASSIKNLIQSNIRFFKLLQIEIRIYFDIYIKNND